jgi:hypothetical protein
MKPVIWLRFLVDILSWNLIFDPFKTKIRISPHYIQEYTIKYIILQDKVLKINIPELWQVSIIFCVLSSESAHHYSYRT